MAVRHFRCSYKKEGINCLANLSRGTFVIYAVITRIGREPTLNSQPGGLRLVVKISVQVVLLTFAGIFNSLSPSLGKEEGE